MVNFLRIRRIVRKTDPVAPPVKAPETETTPPAPVKSTFWLSKKEKEGHKGKGHAASGGLPSLGKRR
jgi:hypothetical protein